MTEAKKASKTAAAKPTTQTRTKASAAKKPAPAKVPAATKPATKPAVKAAPETAPEAAAKPRRARPKKAAAVTPEQRRNYVEVAAYYIAARRGFAPGDVLQDWIQAETEIDRLLAEGHLGLLGD